jgi:carbamoyl-phosphate synthase large subunit
MQKKSVKNILVTGAGGASGFSFLRSLQQSDLSLNLFAGDMYEYAAGYYIGDATPVRLPAAAKEPDAYKDALLKSCKEHQIDIVVCSPEPEVMIMSTERETWQREHGINVICTTPETAKLGTDKYALYEALKDKNLNLPKTMMFQTERDLEKWDGGFPCVYKPVDGVSARGLHYPQNMDDLQMIHHFNQRQGKHPKVLLQSLIPGPVQNVYTLGALYWHGELISAGLHHKLRTTPEDGGSAVAGITDAPEGELFQYGLDILNAAGKWHGCVAVEFKVSEKDGRPSLLEINPRLWGFSYMMTQAGVNYPELTIRLACGEAIKTMKERGAPLPYQVGLRMMRMLDHAFF